MPARRGAVGANAPAVDLDRDPRGDIFGLVSVVAVRLYLGQNEHLRSVPAVHAHTPVLPPVDVEHSQRRDALLPHLAEALAIVAVTPAVAALVEPLVTHALRIS